MGGKRRNAAHQEQKMVLLAPLGIKVPSLCINTSKKSIISVPPSKTAPRPPSDNTKHGRWRRGARGRAGRAACAQGAHISGLKWIAPKMAHGGLRRFLARACSVTGGFVVQYSPVFVSKFGHVPAPNKFGTDTSPNSYSTVWAVGVDQD